MAEPKVRTTEPGVYARGPRFMAVWREGGKQHTKTFRTFDAAVRHRRDALWRVERAKLKDEALLRSGSVATLYGLIRRAAQEADRAGARVALAHLYDAEDAARRAL